MEKKKNMKKPSNNNSKKGSPIKKNVVKEIEPIKEEKKETVRNNKCELANYTKEIVIIASIIIVILLGVIGYLIYKGNHPKLSDGKQVVASLDGKDFTTEELYAELNNKTGHSALISLIDNYIIEKENLDTEDAEVYADSIIEQYRAQYKNYDITFEEDLKNSGYKNVDEFKQVVMNSYLYNEIAEKYLKESITEKELKDYYNNHVSDELNVKHILIAPDVDQDATSDEKKKAEKEALNKAKDLIKQLEKGADFDTLAKENSDDEGSAANGGAINNVIKDKYVTEFWNAAYELKVNEYTKEPVKSAYGYHIILKVSHTEKQSFEDLKDSLYTNVIEAKTAEDQNLIDKTWVEIRKKYNLNIVDTNIQNKYEAAIRQLNQ